MRSTALSIVAILTLSAPIALAADPTPRHDAEARAACQAALDRMDDLASTPAANISLTSDAAAGLAQGLALCRAGRSDKGAVLVRRAIQEIHVAE